MNNRQITMNTKFLAPLFLVFSFLFISEAHAQWTEPTLTPPSGNVLGPLRLDANGNLGIGVTTAGARLDIVRPGNANVYENGIRVNRPDAVGNYAFIGYGQTTSDAYFGSTYVGAAGSYGQIHLRQYGQAGAFRDALNIISNGNVGIGTTAPAGKLDINARANGSGYGLFVDTTTRTTGEEYVRFGDTTTSDFSVTTSGNVGIGTNLPTYKLSVAGDVNVPTGSCYRVNGTCITSGGLAGSGTANNLAMFTAASTLGDSNVAQQTNGSVRVTNSFGYGNFGPQNASWNHIYTDRPNTIINTGVFSTTGVFSSYTPSDLRLQTNGTDRIRVLTSNGNVGIGTTAPGDKLDVVGNMRLSLAGTPTVGTYQAITFPVGIYNKAQIRGYSTGTTDAGELAFLTAPAGDIVTERVRIGSTGNVGIGTASPTQRLTVNGNINKVGSWILSGNANWGVNSLEVYNSNWDGASNNNYGTLAAGHIYSYNGLQSGGASGAEAGDGQLYVSGRSMLMGPVGIGSAAAPFSSSMLEVTGGPIRVTNPAGSGLDVFDGTNMTSISSTGITTRNISATSNTTTVIGVTYGSASPGIQGVAHSATAYGVYGSNSNSTGYGIYCATGRCGSNGVSWTTTSDGRLKEKVSTITNGLDKILKLRGVNYTWKDGRIKGNQVGFIAQEAMEVVPESVTQDGDGTYSMSYERIVPVLVEAVKELKAENDDLKVRLERLEAKLK